MLTMLLSRIWGNPRVRHGLTGCLAFALLVPAPVHAQPQTPAKGGGPPPQKAATAPNAKTDGATKPSGDADESKPAVAKAAPSPEAAPVDPSQTRRIARNEIFRDPRAEKLLEINRFQRVGTRVVPDTEILELNAVAGGANPNLDKALIDRVIDAMVAKLTDHANIQALIDPPDKMSPSAPVAHAIQDATTALVQPIFLAQSANPKNLNFLTIYNRSLIQKLTPLLKNHLIPRVEAMIVLGEAASPEMVPIYEAQIKDPNQTVWVKLWALQGLVNVNEQGGRLPGQAQVEAAREVADFLAAEDDAPWPVQLRALEALTAMRQGFDPNRPQDRQHGQRGDEAAHGSRREAGSPLGGGQSAGLHADQCVGTPVQLWARCPRHRPACRGTGHRPGSPDFVQTRERLGCRQGEGCRTAGCGARRPHPKRDICPIRTRPST